MNNTRIKLISHNFHASIELKVKLEAFQKSHIRYMIKPFISTLEAIQ